MKTSELYKRLEELIPPSLSCEWDNDGLSVLPCPWHESKRVLIALDVRSEVIEYAEEHGFDTVITHHPLIFSPLKSVSGDTVASAKAVRLINSGIAAISFHTRFDAMEGGVSDTLCGKLGIEPDMTFGEGGCARLCRMDERDFDMLVSDIKKLFGGAHFFCEKASERVSVAAVCAGAASDTVYDALRLGADVLICGEIKYHAAIDAADAGLSVISVGHYESESPALRVLQKLVNSAGDVITEVYEVEQYAV